jgi:hypothetical protein
MWPLEPNELQAHHWLDLALARLRVMRGPGERYSDRREQRTILEICVALGGSGLDDDGNQSARCNGEWTSTELTAASYGTRPCKGENGDKRTPALPQ